MQAGVLDNSDVVGAPFALMNRLYNTANQHALWNNFTLIRYTFHYADVLYDAPEDRSTHEINNSNFGIFLINDQHHFHFSAERDYVTYNAIANPSVCRLWRACTLHPTQGV